jgi:hypothetical protein
MGEIKSGICDALLNLTKGSSIDLDLEGGSVLFWPTFINQIRSRESGGSKTSVWLAAASVCL